MIDFSHPDNLASVLNFVKTKKCALVYGTTGLNEDQINSLKQVSDEIPVFYSANFSYGIAVFEQILKQFAIKNFIFFQVMHIMTIIQKIFLN